MICLGFPESRFQVFLLILYTCIWLPLQRLKEATVEAVLALFGDQVQRPAAETRFDRGTGGAVDQIIIPEHLSVAKFREIRGTAAAAAAEETVCSVCLMEFEEEEEVSQLPACGHVFHDPCIQRWIERDQFSCPLCRSSIFASNDIQLGF